LLKNLSERIKELDQKIERTERRNNAWDGSLINAELLYKAFTRLNGDTVEGNLFKELLASRVDELRELIENSDVQVPLQKRRRLSALREKLILRLQTADRLYRMIGEFDKERNGG